MVGSRASLRMCALVVTLAAVTATGTVSAFALQASAGRVEFSNGSGPLFALPWRAVSLFEPGDLVPDAIDLTPDGDLLVASSAAGVVLRVHEGVEVWRYGATERGLGAFEPCAVHPASDGRVLVVDRANREVIEVDAAGKVVWSWSAGDRVPVDASRRDDGTTFVALEGPGSNVVLVGDDGVLWRSPSDLVAAPGSVEAQADGSVLVTDLGLATGSKVLSVTPSSTADARVAWRLTSTDVPGVSAFRGATVLSDGRVAVCDPVGSRVLLVSREATAGTTSIQAPVIGIAPCSIVQSPRGTLLVADAASRSVSEIGRAASAEVAASFTPSSRAVITAITCDASDAEARLWVAADDGEWCEIEDADAELPLGEVLRWRAELVAQDPLSNAELRSVTLHYELLADGDGGSDDDGWLPEDVASEGFSSTLDADPAPRESTPPAASDDPEPVTSPTSDTAEDMPETEAAPEPVAQAAPVLGSADASSDASAAGSKTAPAKQGGALLLGGLWALGLVARPARDSITQWAARGMHAPSPSRIHRFLHRFFS